MKKVIFISALAIAAAVSCTKSDIVDTKFNEAISFENYVGRDAMTKATPYGANALPEKVGVYGFYTGTAEWTNTSAANLWSNLELTKGTDGSYTYDEDDKKYWTNATDLYTFLAYAPFADNNGLTVTTGANPKVTYTVDTDLEGIDLIYANAPATNGVGGHVNMVKPANGAAVNLQFKHALARLTVTAAAKEANQAFKFDVKEVSISGNFNTTGTLTLADANPANEENNGWSATQATASAYEFYSDYADSYTAGVDGAPGTWDVLDTEGINYATDRTETGKNDKYLMMIPTDFTNTGATLKVVYTSIYAEQESGRMTKELTVKQNFEMGKAYSINIVFDPVLDDIQFSVTVADWETTENPREDITAGNPEGVGQEGNNWVDTTPTTGEGEGDDNTQGA